MGDKIDLDKPRRWIVPNAERPHRHRATHRRTEAGTPPATAARHQPSRTSESKRSIVAGLMVSNSARIVSSIASWPCRSTAGNSTGMIGFSRFEQSRSEASHSTINACWTSIPYRRWMRRGTAASSPIFGRSSRIACFR
jgi:hypothetical protein